MTSAAQAADAAVDVIAAEIIRNALASAAVEMNKTLVRTAFNPLLYDIQDFGIAIVSADGDLWAEAPGVAVFLGATPETIRTGLAKHGREGFAEGDIVIANDPFLTGTHISDTSVYTPVFADDDLIAFAIVTAHWADIGGRTPGGWDVDSTELYQEGICFTHQKLVAGGRVNADLFDLISSNVRVPDMVRGDLDAQIAACRQGTERIQALCRKYGAKVVRRAMDFVIDRTAEAMHQEVRGIPDGTYAAGTELDHDGVVKDVHPQVRVSLQVAGDRIRVSFPGSSPRTVGPINVPEIGTRSAVRAAVKGLLAPLDPTNEGHFACLDFAIEPGLVVSAQRPAPCDSFGYVVNTLIELSQLAMARALPDRCRAGSYQLLGVYFFRVDPQVGPPFIMIDAVDGGHGALPHADGATLIFVADGDTPNLPAEVIETRYPVRLERFASLAASAGAGAHRGGCGVIREYRVLERGTYMKTALESTRVPLAKGVLGGQDGKPSEIVLWPGTDRETLANDRLGMFSLAPGDVVMLRAGGGGGYGPPRERDPDLVVRDVRDEFLAPEEAASVYGVVLTRHGEDWVVDEAATRARRAQTP